MRCLGCCSAVAQFDAFFTWRMQNRSHFLSQGSRTMSSPHPDRTAPMTHKSHAKVSNVRVDWSDPQLESLLHRSESWRLDNRGGYSPQDVQVYLGWSGTVGRAAVLVWERDQSVVLETDFPIGQGEQIRVDKHLGESIRTLWGVVVEERKGQREEDRLKGLHLYWLHVR